MLINYSRDDDAEPCEHKNNLRDSFFQLFSVFHHTRTDKHKKIARVDSRNKPRE